MNNLNFSIGKNADKSYYLLVLKRINDEDNMAIKLQFRPLKEGETHTEIKAIESFSEDSFRDLFGHIEPIAKELGLILNDDELKQKYERKISYLKQIMEDEKKLLLLKTERDFWQKTALAYMPNDVAKIFNKEEV